MLGLFGPRHFFFLLFGLGFGLLVNLLLAVLLYLDYQRIPPRFRKQDPNMVWLLLIPCFHIVWNFFVYPGLSDSFKAYFDSVGDASVGNCGRDLALGYAVCAAASIIPFLGCLTGLAALVLVVLYLIKANELKNRIPISA